MSEPLSSQTAPPRPQPTLISSIIALVLANLAVAILAACATYFYVNKENIKANFAVLLSQQKSAQTAGFVPIQQPMVAGPPVAVNAVQASFHAPFPVTWEDTQATYYVTDVWVGDIKLGNGLVNYEGGKDYQSGDTVHGVLVRLRIDTHSNASCIEMGIRRISNEGDLFPPNTRQFMFPDTGGCAAKPNTTYRNMDVIFVVPESEHTFKFSGTADIKNAFSVIVANSSVSVLKD